MKIYYITGADGTGKSTLANKIAEETKGSVIHSTFDRDWDIESYHKDVILAAKILSKYTPVVLDRWAVDEYIYGKVFRGGESYDTSTFIGEHMNDITFIYCTNNYVLENHEINKQKRKEMFSSMKDIKAEYDKYILETPGLNWHIFDFYKTTTEKFLKEIL